MLTLNFLCRFGAPIYPSLQDGDDFNAKTEELTHTIENGIRNCTVNAESWEDLMLIDLGSPFYRLQQNAHPYLLHCLQVVKSTLPTTS